MDSIGMGGRFGPEYAIASRDRVVEGIAAQACSNDGLTGAKECLCENLCMKCSESSTTRRPEFGIAAMIDHTLLKPDATESELNELCEEAVKYGFASVCVNPTNVAYCAELLRGTNVKVCTVIGFPLGATTTISKVIEARDAVANGVQEVDMVMNIGARKSGHYNLVMRDIRSVVEAVAGKCITKVIIETALLSNEDKIRACLGICSETPQGQA